jgi:CRP-like cAMP-binding protein
MGPGLFFGDTALDFEINKRNATIRAEEETVLAYLKRNDYLSIISPKHKQEILKEMEFIYENFFFTSINSHIFEKNFFHLFSPREYYRGNILFSNGTIPRSLILVKSGRISLELKCSIIDIQNLIKFIYNNISSNPLFAKLSQVKKNKYLPPEKLSIIKNYINDPVLTRLKMHNNKFIEEMNVIRSYQIKILTTNETIGLEEIFLRLPYLMKATVINQKVYCFELELEHIEKMLNSGKDVAHSYIKSSVNKILSLIERLQNIKQNCINMSLVKYEKEMLKYKGWKKIDIHSKNKSYQNSKKEENKFEKIRNPKINADKKRKNIEKEINKSNNLDNDNENEGEK